MATCTGYIEPLNLKCLLVNTFSGSPTVFTFIAYFFIVSLAAYFKMSGFVVALIMIVFTVFIHVEGSLGLSPILLIILVIMPMIIYSIIGKLVKN